MSEQGSRERDIIRAVPPVALLRAAEDGDTETTPTLFGHFARFNEWTEIDSWFEGRFMERIAPRAFRKTFAEQRDELRVLFQHGHDPQVGDKPIAEIQELKEDDEGGYYEARLFDGIPPLIVEGLRAGQYGQSFKMRVMREEIQDDPGTSDLNPQGLPERTIKEVRLYEFGPVTFPAYKNTTAGLRSMNDEFIFDWIAKHPDRARELVAARDLSEAAMRSIGKPASCACEHRELGDHEIACSRFHNVKPGCCEPHDKLIPAPSATDAALKGTSVPERREPSAGYGLVKTEQRPGWAL